ncbi:hypothetical protein [Thermocoleostomius sinensis]|uniref:Uncharacterized protein n=1 Tax=Thermocoleostomius sinensis A174 TaxID=2016057 RepID=A0A9E8Z905_9CYAN|nr:hypothetical protein [Thermocoleostomius sinensis]WAL58522.1 hypothetical protein OXH18_15175 [Thermocoleostomius sinensis A174]
MRSNRVKLCHGCAQPASTLYRVRQDASAKWVFVCKHCWPTVYQNNPYYVYGGTWKADKQR